MKSFGEQTTHAKLHYKFCSECDKTKNPELGEICPEMCFNVDSCTILYVILLAVSTERLKIKELFNKKMRSFIFAKHRSILHRYSIICGFH